MIVFNFLDFCFVHDQYPNTHIGFCKETRIVIQAKAICLASYHLISSSRDKKIEEEILKSRKS